MRNSAETAGRNKAHAGAVASSGVTEAESDSEGDKRRAGGRLRSNPTGTRQSDHGREKPGDPPQVDGKDQEFPHQSRQGLDKRGDDKEHRHAKLGIVHRRLVPVPGVKAIYEWRQGREDEYQACDALEDTARHCSRIDTRAWPGNPAY